MIRFYAKILKSVRGTCTFGINHDHKISCIEANLTRVAKGPSSLKGCKDPSGENINHRCCQMAPQLHSIMLTHLFRGLHLLCFGCCSTSMQCMIWAALALRALVLAQRQKCSAHGRNVSATGAGVAVAPHSVNPSHTRKQNDDERPKDIGDRPKGCGGQNCYGQCPY